MDQSSDICSQWKSLDFAFKSVDFEKNLEKVIEELQNQPARNDVVFIDKVMNLQKTVRLVYPCCYFQLSIVYLLLNICFNWLENVDFLSVFNESVGESDAPDMELPK